MTRAQADTANRAGFSVQAIAITLRPLGRIETSVDPAAMGCLGQPLEEAHTTIGGALHATSKEGVA